MMNTDRLQNRTGTVANTPLSNRSRRRNRGASLIEVLVVLVIILIGILVVIQIFPIGFTSLKKSEARLRADRLARNTTESLTVDSSTLPESITFSYYDASGNLQTETNQDPDDLGTFGGAANKLYFSDVNKYRYVKNEPIRVPLPTATGNTGFGPGVGSVHFLSFGPIYMDKTVGGPASVPTNATEQKLYDSYLKISSEKLIGTSVESSDDRGTQLLPGNFQRYFSGANSYVIDYGDGKTDPVILFPQASKDRTYSITFSSEDESGSPATIASTTITITVPQNTFAWQPLGTRTILSGSETVTRNFTRLKADDPTTGANENEPWDPTDPYQYKLVSNNLSNNANLGVVAFNPAGANYSVTVPGGTKPFTALASYAVLDWHILKDDREVPAGSDGVGKVRTSLPNIRLKGDEFVDFTATGADRSQVYPGLYPQTGIYHPGDTLPDNTVSPDIQVFSLSDSAGSARLLTPGDLANKGTLASPGPDANADYWINRSGRGGTYPTGTLYVNTERVPPGSKVRILYKAQGDWAVSFQKAATTYRNEPGTGSRPVGNKAEVFTVDTMGTATFNDDRIYFHRSELNKGVTGTFEVDTAAGTTRLSSRQFTIANADGDYSYALAADVAPEIAQTGVTGWRVYGNISGASLKTRVIWQDEQNGRNPWRISDLETFVTNQAQ